jgi:hypothetical protein
VTTTDEQDARPALPRRVSLVAGFLALAALPALGVSAYAAADATGSTSVVTGGPTQPSTAAPRAASDDAAPGCNHATPGHGPGPDVGVDDPRDTAV